MDIACMQILGECIEIIINSDNKTKHLYLQGSLDYFEQQLPVAFFRCHRSALINIAYLKSFDEEQIILALPKQAETVLPFAKSRHKPLEQLLSGMYRLKIPSCRHCEKCKDRDNCQEISIFTRIGTDWK
jgi:hypothetical protein